MKENVTNLEKSKKQLEQNIVELQNRIEQAEASALKGGKRTIQKLEQRVRKTNKKLTFIKNIN